MKTAPLGQRASPGMSESDGQTAVWRHVTAKSGETTLGMAENHTKARAVGGSNMHSVFESRRTQHKHENSPSFPRLSPRYDPPHTPTAWVFIFR